MARKFLTHVDLAKNELQNAAIQNLGTAPSTPATGQIYFDTGLKTLRVYDGANWGPVGGAAYAAGAPSSTPATVGSLYFDTTNLVLYVAKGTASSADWVPSDPRGATGDMAATSLSTANAAGSSLKVAPIDHVHRHIDADHSGIHLNALAAATADYSMGGFKLTNLGTPTATTDAATKAYVDAAAVGIEWKASVRVATTAAGTLASSFANGSVVDGITLATGDRILIKDQAAGAENGIYTVNATGAPTRATDADTAAEVNSGMAVFVEVGTVNADSGWVLTTDGAITLGTTALVFTQFTGLGQVTAGSGLTKTGNTLNVGGTTNRISVSADAVDIDANYVGQSTITTLGTVTTGTWSATTIAANKGGTGQTSYAIGDLLYADTASSLGKLADVATGNVLISGGVGAAPSWGKVGLTTHITGTLAVGNGGTGATTLTSNGVLLGNGTSAVSATTAGTADQVLRIPGAGGAPAFGAIDLTKAAAVTGALPVANGGTGATTAAGARTNLGATTKVTGTNTLGTSTVINHALGQWVTVQLFDTATGAQVDADVTNAATAGGTTTITFTQSQTAGAFTYVIIG